MKTFELHQFDDGKGIIWRLVTWEDGSVLDVIESADQTYLSVLRKMAKSVHGVVLPTRAKLERLFAERVDQYAMQVAHLSGDTWTAGSLPTPTAEERRMQRHLKYNAQFPLKCGARGDFGHTNVWGTPYLMFDTYCTLPVGHDGKHECKCDIRVKPTHEEAGRAIEDKSTEVVGETRIRWSLRPDAEEKVRWRGVLETWGRIGHFLSQDLRK